MGKLYMGFLLDLDGVLFRGDEVIESGVKAVNKWKRRGCKVMYMTNNSTRLPIEYRGKLAGIGVEDVNTEDIITSGTVTADYLEEKEGMESGKRVLCVAKPAVKKLLEDNGFVAELVQEFDPADCPPEWIEGVDYVVVGEAQYPRRGEPPLTTAHLYIPANAIHQGAKFIAANPDPTDPEPGGKIKPVAGALIAYLETATGKKPKILGKPHPAMYTQALQKISLPKNQILVIGDRLDTDIAGAQKQDLDTCLVTTGTHTKKDTKKHKIKPTITVENLGEIK